MTQAALNRLEQDEDGFFLMVEGGQIDWAGHSNDAGTMLNEMVKFEEAVQGVYDWAKGRDDTVILVTADHETGGFGLSYSSADLPEPQSKSGPAFAERDYAPNFNFGDVALLDSLYQQKASFSTLLSEFGALDEAQRTPARLMEMVNANSDFQIDEAQAEAVLANKPNPYTWRGTAISTPRRCRPSRTSMPSTPITIGAMCWGVSWAPSRMSSGAPVRIPTPR